MAATNVESFVNARDSLPNVYTDITAREIDFVTRFGQSWKALQEILGISRPIERATGSVLKSYTASINLESGEVPAGAVIPYSKATVVEKLFGEVKLEKYAKAATIEDVDKYGEVVAIEKTDDAFLTELQNNVTDSLYTFIQDDTYAITDTVSTWQMGVAMAIGLVKNKFQIMRKNVTDVVVIANILDAYAYMGSANLTVQTAFGINYVQDFLGAKVMILSSEIDRGKVIGIPADNLIVYYINPETAFAKLGLVYRTDGETNLIGFHAQGNYSTAVGESFALQGMKFWCEYADGVSIVTVDANPLKGVTVESESAGTTFPWTDKTPSDFQSDVAVENGVITGNLAYIDGGLSPAGPLAGSGYFLALKWSNPDASATSLKVGLVPSASGMAPVECIDDPDRNGVFKISDPTNQVLKVITSNADHKTTQIFRLTGLVLEETGA